MMYFNLSTENEEKLIINNSNINQNPCLVCPHKKNKTNIAIFSPIFRLTVVLLNFAFTLRLINETWTIHARAGWHAGKSIG